MFLFVAFLLTTNLSAQRQLQDKVESFKIGFLTEKMELTPEESEKFWPLYKEFKKKIKANSSTIKAHAIVDLMDEDDSVRYLDKLVSQKKSEYEITRDYMLKMREVLPAKKVALFVSAEREFNMRIIKQARKRN
jgi:hypothetical protein